jgi:hypothetical protein
VVLGIYLYRKFRHGRTLEQMGPADDSGAAD